MKRRTMAERLLAGLLCFVLVLGLLPAGAMHAEAADEALGTVTAATEGLSVNDADNTNVSVSLGKELTLEKVEADPSLSNGRPEGWYVGIAIAAPEGYAEDAAFNCYRPENNNSLAVSFVDNKDTAEGNVITMWARITEEWVKAGEITYKWEMDWNADGTYEQTVTLTVDPAKVILMDGENKVWPEDVAETFYGTVVSNSGGVINDTDPAEISVNYDGVVVVWNNGWSVSATVTAPANANLDKATINGEKFSENGEASQTYTRTFTSAGTEKIEDMTGKFDWDGDGNADQTIAMVGEVTLEKAEQEAPVFANSASEIVINTGDLSTEGGFFNPTHYYSNAVTNGSVGELSYSYAEESVAGVVTKQENNKVIFDWDKLTDAVKGNSPYSVQITAAFAETATHKKAETTYTLIVGRKLDTGVTFNNPGPVVKVYGSEEGNTYSNEVKGIAEWNGHSLAESITYSSSNPEIASVNDKGVVTFKGIGEVVISATVVYNQWYNPTTVSYKLEIQKGNQPLEISGPDAIEYVEGTEVAEEYTVSGVAVTDVDLVVSSSNPDVATVELKDGVIVVTPVSTGTFTLTVSHPGNKFYEIAEKTLEIQVLYKQINVAFENEGPINVNYNDNNNQYTNVLVGAQGDGALTYVSSDESIATVDENGVVTINTAGTVVITATKAEDATYATVSASYTLNIAKVDQQIAFADTDAAHTVDNSAESYTIEMAPTAGWYALDSNTVKFQYNIESQTNKIKDTCLSTDENGNCVVNIGEGDYGVITIKATRPGDACFNDWAGAVYTLTINEITIEGEFQFSGETKNDSGWYTSTGKLTHTGGYQLAKHVEKGWHSWNEEYPLNTDGVHNVILCMKKGYGRKDNYPAGTYKIDTQAPKSEIFYKDDLWGKVLETLSFGYYKETMTVTIRATDATSGVALIHYNYNGEWKSAAPNENGEITFDIYPEYRGKVQYYAVDVAGNDERNGKENNAANTGNVEIIVDTVDPEIAVTWSEAQQVTEDGTRYYDDKAVATITIKEANFFNGEAEASSKGEGVLVFVNNEAGKLDSNEWKQAVDADGNPIADTWVNTVTLSAEGDHVLNIQYADRSKNGADYTSETITIDKTNPKVSVNIDAAENRIYNNKDTVVTVTIEEHNFNPNDVEFILTSVDSANAVEEAPVSYSEWKSNGDVHTIDLTFSVDANYTLDVACVDLAMRESNDLPVQMLTVDKKDPTDLAIAYTNDIWGEVLEALSFGYYDAQMTVTISAADATSGVAEIFYNYDGEWKSAVPANGQISFTIDPQYRGKVQYYAVDKASNDTEKITGNVELIVDTEKPEIAVEWSDAEQVAADGTRYYSDKAVATITIVDPNFFNGEAYIDANRELNQDASLDAARAGVLVYDNGAAVKLDSQKWAEATDEEGNKIPNTWVNTVTLSAEGDHVLNVQYTDRSNNKAKAYNSKTITIDHTDPKVSLNIDAAENRIYSDKNMTVTVTVEEHNFNAADVNFILTSVNSSEVTVEAPVSYSEWKSNGDVHTIDLTFSVDANYTLDVEYADMAKRAANNLPVQMLTVDKVAPVIASVTYSNGITAGYYNAPMRVTVLVTDDTAGVDRFVYSYIKHEGVSGVNTEMLNQTDAVITHEAGTNEYTVEFQIPKEAVLSNKNQFNGYVDVTAYDRSGNNSNENQKEDQTIVVDNIAPTANISFNAPVKTKNDVSYYAGNIEATIVINEANFFANEVNVSVTRNGANYPVKVNWTNNSVDKHTGTFTLAEDGDYVVKVTYQDRSSNQMAAYTSNQLTRDTQLPTIAVSNIVSDSANTDAVYSFTVTAEDINFDLDAFIVSLHAAVYNEDGTFSTEIINLGEPVAVVAGKTYTYEITNLEKDAIYTLSCAATDLAGNNYSKMLLDDGKEYGEVRFSINRNGSTFYLDENTSKLVEDYYNYNVLNDLVVFEINADVLESHSVTLNGKELVEGTDYTVTAEGGNGSWMRYTYTVNKTLFEAEGEYQLVVSSKDKAGNDAFSDVKNATVRFVVDRTAPVITVTGMANGGRYQTESQTVTLIPTDDGGALSSILVKLVDDNGETIKELINLSGEELAEALESGDGRLSFQIGEGLYQNVQIVCEDCSASEEGHNVYDETFKDLSVSASGFMIFWANRVLRYSVIFGLLLIVLLVVYMLTRKKKKN